MSLWLLGIAVALVVYVLRELLNFIDETIGNWRKEKVQRKQRRQAIRKNINELIEMLSRVDDPGLDRALQDSIIEYRVLS